MVIEIRFFSPNDLNFDDFRCGHCQKLAPTFEELARALEHETTVSIAKLDCTEFRPICKDFDVKGYPTLLWLENGKKIDKYSGPRSLDDLKAYVEQKSSTADKPVEKVEAKEEGEGVAVLQLVPETFPSTIENGVTFIKFFAPWCGHCKRMAPTWQQLAEKFVGNLNIKIAKVNFELILFKIENILKFIFRSIAHCKKTAICAMNRRSTVSLLYTSTRTVRRSLSTTEVVPWMTCMTLSTLTLLKRLGTSCKLIFLRHHPISSS